MMGFFGGFIAVAGFMVGIFMFVITFALLVVYPWNLIWLVPVGYLVCRKVYHKVFKHKYRPMDRSEYHMLFPPGHQDEARQQHYVEPFTIGGHVRRGHSGNHHGR